MVRLHDWHIQNVNGRRLLRFTTIFVNEGPGRFELRGARSSSSDKTMEIDQVLYRADGSRFRRDTEAVAKYAGDGHDHWHVQGVVTYEAWALTDPQSARRGAKTGFCFFDTTPWKLSLPHARQSGYYEQEWCGTQASHDEPGRRVGGLGRSLPVGLRLPVDRHHRAARRHLPRAGHGRHPGLLPRDGRARQLRLDRDPHPGTRIGQHGAGAPQRTRLRRAGDHPGLLLRRQARPSIRRAT